MTPASATSLELARELLLLEGGGPQCSPDCPVIAEDQLSQPETLMRVCEKLRNLLVAFSGLAGFQSLLSRAVTLARMQEPGLVHVQVLEDGHLSGLETIPTGAGGQILLAHFLDLLVLFIGEPLTHQIVRSAWPDAPPGALHSGDKDEP